MSTEDVDKILSFFASYAEVRINIEMKGIVVQDWQKSELTFRKSFY